MVVLKWENHSVGTIFSLHFLLGCCERINIIFNGWNMCHFWLQYFGRAKNWRLKRAKNMKESCCSPPSKIVIFKEAEGRRFLRSISNWRRRQAINWPTVGAKNLRKANILQIGRTRSWAYTLGRAQDFLLNMLREVITCSMLCLFWHEHRESDFIKLKMGLRTTWFRWATNLLISKVHQLHKEDEDCNSQNTKNMLRFFFKKWREIQTAIIS